MCRPKKGGSTPKKSASRGRSTGRKGKQEESDDDAVELTVQKKGICGILLLFCLLTANYTCRLHWVGVGLKVCFKYISLIIAIGSDVV